MSTEGGARGQRRTGSLDLRHLRQLTLFETVADVDVATLLRHGLWWRPTRSTTFGATEIGAENVVIVADGDIAMGAEAPGATSFIPLLLDVEDVFDPPRLHLGAIDTCYAEVISAQAMIYRLDSTAFYQLSRAYAHLRDSVEGQTLRQFHDAGDLLLDFARRDALARVAHLLARLTAHYGVNVPLKHDVLGRMVKMDRADVTKGLVELRERGLIWYAGRTGGIRVLAAEDLRMFGRWRG